MCTSTTPFTSLWHSRYSIRHPSQHSLFAHISKHFKSVLHNKRHMFLVLNTYYLKPAEIICKPASIFTPNLPHYHTIHTFPLPPYCGDLGSESIPSCIRIQSQQKHACVLTIQSQKKHACVLTENVKPLSIQQQENTLFYLHNSEKHLCIILAL